MTILYFSASEAFIELNPNSRGVDLMSQAGMEHSLKQASNFEVRPQLTWNS